MTRRILKLRIEVEVNCPNGSLIGPNVVDAMRELVNRRDFRTNTIKQGRALTHESDFGDTRTTVDVFVQNIEAEQ